MLLDLPDPLVLVLMEQPEQVVFRELLALLVTLALLEQLALLVGWSHWSCGVGATGATGPGVTLVQLDVRVPGCNLEQVVFRELLVSLGLLVLLVP